MKASTNNCFISAKQWVMHYKSLYHKPPDIDDDILDKLKEAEIIGKGNNILDYDISDKELFHTINTLKCKKSPGLDNIINEMLKCGKDYLVPVIKKLFNLILNCGYFPSLWKKGFIINIHKAVVKSEPNNYRYIVSYFHLKASKKRTDFYTTT